MIIILVSHLIQVIYRVCCISVRLLPITLMHKFNSDKSVTIKIGPLFNFKCTELTLCNCIKFVESPRCVYQSRQKYF